MPSITVRMRPMALAEHAVTTPAVRLATLLEGARPALDGATRLSLADYAHEIVRSGFPALRDYGGRLLAAAPVHQLADPALAARLLGVDAGALVDGAAAGPPIPRDGTLLGALFQSLVTLSVRTYAQAGEARVGHLRTRGGEHEIDLIVERRDGRVVALEVKLSATVEDADTRHLKWLADRLGPDLLDACVITTGHEAYRRADGIGVIPAGAADGLMPARRAEIRVQERVPSRRTADPAAPRSSWRISSISRRNPGSTGSADTLAGAASCSGAESGRYTKTSPPDGSISQPRRAPLSMYSRILSWSTGRLSLDERNSTTKSGQRGMNPARCSSVRTARRALETQEASGERTAPFGSRKPPEESNVLPVPSRFAQRLN